MIQSKSEIEAEIADFKGRIAAIHESEPFEAQSEDGTRLVEIDPQDGLNVLMEQLDDAYARLQQILSREAYLKASGG